MGMNETIDVFSFLRQLNVFNLCSYFRISFKTFAAFAELGSYMDNRLVNYVDDRLVNYVDDRLVN